MIYIAYILIFMIAIFARDEEFLSLPGVGWMFAVCAFILPIWWGIRECVRELEKIRKLMEKAIGGKEDV